MKKRVLAVLLSACMAAAVPYPVLAADTAASTAEARTEIAAEEEPEKEEETEENITSTESAGQEKEIPGTERDYASAAEDKVYIYVNKRNTYEYWVKGGKKTAACPGGVSFDTSGSTLTLNNYSGRERLYISYYPFDDEDHAALRQVPKITIQFTGTNTLAGIEFEEPEELVFSGSGSLKANNLDIYKLTVNSGTYNLNVTDSYSDAIDSTNFTMNGGKINITSSGTGYCGIRIQYDEGTMRFLGGSVNINGNFRGAINAEYGSIEVRNASIAIRQNGSYGEYGICCGTQDDGLIGGNLTLENANITVDASNFGSDGYKVLSFYHLNDVGSNHKYYTTTGGEQQNMSFDKAFTTVKEGNVTRYERKLSSSVSKQNNSFRITSGSDTKIHGLAFSDVSDASNSYYDAVYWAAEKGITTGYSNGTFGVSKNCSRGAFVTFLWRQQGSPEPKLTAEESGLKDFGSIGKSYQKAVLWAVEKGITTGYGDHTFRAGANVTRGAAVTFLYRAAGEPKVSITRKDVTFKDMVPAGSSYETGILWAVENKITTGYKKDNTFRPANNCTRGATVTFLKRFDELR